MKHLLFKVALFLAYSVFAGYSAWMTATSVQLKWMSQMPIWFVFIMIFIIALFAGWCLDNSIKELKNPTNPSKVRFFLNLLGFIVFWTFSFMTNVHYNVIQEYGESNLSAQLADCKRYLVANSADSLARVEDERDKAIRDFSSTCLRHREKIVSQLENLDEGMLGCGPAAKLLLTEYENMIKASANSFNDTYDYTGCVYDEQRDRNYDSKKINDWTNVHKLVIPHFTDLMDKAEKHHKKAIESYYKKKISKIVDNQKNLETVAFYENKLDSLKSQGNSSYSEYFKLYKSMDEYLLSKVEGYKESNLIYVKDKDGNNVFEGYKIYPSDRMFNFWNVWKDWFNGYLPAHISLAGQFIWSIIIDLIAFILICLIF